MSARLPRRRVTSRRRALALLVASGLALVGLVVLAVGWLGIGMTTLRASAAGTEPCVAAYEGGAGVQIRYELLPARSVCVWDVDGMRQEVVIASVPPAVTGGALVLALGGIAGTAAVLVRSRRPRAAVSPAPGGTTGPTPAGPTP
ncbi:hypothetical protein [Cellulomonas xiejunii]|uniref:Integral membrane protein n=1 Tax=Cellulomonas xiejunii TaxID=2968083 RepID=A0ABY5KR90_9CELL|nr:hypothetical protein [Cellulomonas xiejunii]MCC2315237.1 hypothetical protein [Cellulomonas xiejunii]MCC2321620.1 hypothetical protein [Cellulomonas xiejunii]UUI72935.1 hypothetical protein NP048_05700 [Cellulomonas xiejunii]